MARQISRIQLRRGTTASWAAENPILLSGEMGVDITTGESRIGNGVDPWSGLPRATDAATAASTASAAATTATGAASTATTQASNASSSATLAQQWAANPEDDTVPGGGGLFSSLHYNAKAAAIVETIAPLPTLEQIVVDAEQAEANAAGHAIAADASRVLAQTAAANAQADSRTTATWTALAALTGAVAGEGAGVLDSDTGTHTDPVVGGTVANAGRYSWSASPAGWQRIGTTGLTAKVSKRGAQIAPCAFPGVAYVVDAGDFPQTRQGCVERISVSSEVALAQPSLALCPTPREDGSLDFDGHWMANTIVARPVASYHLPTPSMNPNPSGGFTNTGLARDSAGRFLIGHQGLTDAASSSFATAIIEVSPDFRTILREISVVALFPASRSLQGLAWDSTDDTIWAAVYGASTGHIRHFTRAGADAGGHITLGYQPNGLAYNSVTDELYISGNGGTSATGAVIEVRSAADGTLVRSFNAPTLVDHLHWDGTWLYFFPPTAIGVPGQVFAGTPEGREVWRIETLADVTASEGSVIVGNRIWSCHDGGFHTDAQLPLSMVFEFEFDRPPAAAGAATTLAAGLVKRDATAASSRILVAHGFPETSGNNGWGLYWVANQDRVRLLARNGSATYLMEWAFACRADAAIFAIEITAGASTPTFYRNGVAVTAHSSSGNLASARHGFGIGDFSLGALRDGTSVGECDIFGVVLGSDFSSREEVEGWLAHRNSRTDLLPVDHPYKVTAP